MFVQRNNDTKWGPLGFSIGIKNQPTSGFWAMTRPWVGTSFVPINNAKRNSLYCIPMSSHESTWDVSPTEMDISQVRSIIFSGWYPSQPHWWYTCPSEKYESQLGVWHSQYMESHKMFQTTNQQLYFWVNYNNSLTWIKAIWGWFPLLTMISSELVVSSL